MSKIAVVAGLMGLWAGAGVARAVIVYGNPADPTETGRRSPADAGGLIATGSTLQGDFGNYLGTPIASNYFLTAAHFGVPSGPITTTDGVAHTITGRTQVAGTDLVVYRVAEPFANVASIYNPATDGAFTPGSQIAVYGRGTARGAVLNVGGTDRGWNWAADDHARSFGTNTFEGISAISQSNIDGGSPFALGTQFLVADFDSNAGVTEGTLSTGDSGGAVFVNTVNGLKLVGINYGVTLYGSSATGPRLDAAVYDASGLFVSQGNGVFTPVGVQTQQPWFASYVPGSAAAIAALVPEPRVLGLLLGGTMLLLRKKKR